MLLAPIGCFDPKATLCETSIIIDGGLADAFAADGAGTQSACETMCGANTTQCAAYGPQPYVLVMCPFKGE